MRLSAILLAGLSLALAACVTTQPERPPMPTKPTLTIERRSDGGMCLDRESTAKLATYILELERVAAPE